MTEAEWLACTEPDKMFTFLRPTASGRKLRLLVIACCLGGWSWWYEDRSKRLVELAERLADGEASEAELTEARRIAYPDQLLAMIEPQAADGAFAFVRWAKPEPVSQVKCLPELFNPFRGRRSVDPAWLCWNGGTVRRLAQALYDERAFDRLPALADALEEAGCGDAKILGHLRSPGPHVRGCWAVDLLLGKG
jgi:hypothetical protein